MGGVMIPRPLFMPGSDGEEKQEVRIRMESSEVKDGQGWKPGDVLVGETVKDGDFLESKEADDYFFETEITDPVFERIKGRSFKEDCTVPREKLRYLRVLHWGPKGTTVGELVCDKSVSQALLAVFKELYEEKYPIEKVRLIDEYDADDEASMADNNSSCFNFRKVPGKDKLSLHSLGLAVDINPFYNPYVRTNKEGVLCCSPEGSRPYMDRGRKFPYKIEEGDPCVRIFARHGFLGGGDWTSSKDYQHFSTTGG